METRKGQSGYIINGLRTFRIFLCAHKGCSTAKGFHLKLVRFMVILIYIQGVWAEVESIEFSSYLIWEDQTRSTEELSPGNIGINKTISQWFRMNFLASVKKKWIQKPTQCYNGYDRWWVSKSYLPETEGKDGHEVLIISITCSTYLFIRTSITW